MKLSRSAQRALIITVSAFLSWAVIIALKNWYQSSHTETTSTNHKSSKTFHFNYERDTNFLPKIWKYQAGDDPLWSKNNAYDSDWKKINPVLDLDSLPENYFRGICWFR